MKREYNTSSIYGPGLPHIRRAASMNPGLGGTLDFRIMKCTGCRSWRPSGSGFGSERTLDRYL